MHIFISLFLIIFGILIFWPFTTIPSKKNNYKLLGLSIYLFTCIILAIIYFVSGLNNILFPSNNNIHVNQIILDKNDNRIYNIKINGMSEYDGVSKEDIYALRKQLVLKNSQFVKADYEPNKEILNIDDSAHWWGTKGMICKGPGRYADVGLSKESTYINNPLILLNFGMDKAVTEFADGSSECPDELPLPTKLIIQPSKQTITVHYNISKFLEDRRNSHFYDILEHRYASLFSFENINARDFGYSYAYPEELNNIFYPSAGRNRYYQNRSVTQLNSFLCVNQTCNLPGGCNIVCNPSKSFFIEGFPAYAKFKLFKSYPFSHNAKPDLWFEIYLH